MKYALLFCFLSFFLLSSHLKADSYESMRIARIEITPQNVPADSSFNAQAVRARMNTKVGSLFSQNDLDCDLKMLTDEYEQVEPDIEVINNEIHITLSIWLKATIRKIEFCGNQLVSSKKLKKTLEIEAGATFDREKFIEQFNKLKIVYFKKGFFEAHLDYHIQPIEGCNQVDITISILEGRSGRIRKICFQGLDPCDEEALLECMITQNYHFLFSWFNGKGIYHPDMIEHDRIQIVNYLQNKGFADAVVDLCIEEISCDCIQLVISVDKGICYQIGQICFSGNTLFSDEQIWNAFTFKERWVYSPERIRSTAKAINDLYGSCGYIDAGIDIQLSLRENCPIYDVQVIIDEGKQYYVGLIKVFGNQCTKVGTVLHESLLCPGDVFNSKRLEGTEKRLVHTGLFDTVNVYAVQSQLEEEAENCMFRDIFIEVQEGDTGNVGLFFGFSSIDQLFGGVEVTERNFNIAGVTQLFQKGPRVLRGGGEYAHAKVNIGDRVTSYIFQWTKPYFLDTPWIVGFDLEKADNRALSRAYELKTYGGNIHATYICNEYLKHALTYRLLHTNVSVSGQQTAALDQAAQKTGCISAAGTSFNYDSTDHPRRPTNGFRSRLLYELAGLGGNYQFMKFAYLNTYYYPVSKKSVLKFRADIQFIKTYGTTTANDLPLSERLYLGGETTVRGYRNYIIGPKFANNEPAGGLSSLLLSEEYQYNLLKNPCLDAFAFVDAGAVSKREFYISSLAATVGFGIRIEIMRNMPIMLGLGWPIHPVEYVNGNRVDNTQRFFFAMGGNF